MNKINFDSGWQFRLEASPGEKFSPKDLEKRPVDLPHDWSIGLPRHPDNPSIASGGFFPMGRGVYEKPLPTGAIGPDAKVFLEFEGVYMNAEVFLNENLVGRHPYGYTGFFADLTPFLKTDKENIVKITVDNSHQMNSRWYSGSGIFRHVWLTTCSQVHIVPWGIGVSTPEVTDKKALIRIEATIRNDAREQKNTNIECLLSGSDGSISGKAGTHAAIGPGKERRFVLEMEVPEPKLWSPDSTSLYSLRSDILVDGVITDSTETVFGIRSLSFTAEKGFLLNGKPLKLKGGCVHHDNGILGSASFDRAEERKVELHKASGYNAIRCAHNPPSPAFLEACDRLGMLVIDEAFDCWRQGKNPGDYHLVFDDWWQRDIDSMVLRDRNHPSIVLWSIGNELMERDGRSDGVKIASMLANRVRELDPSRPVTAAMCGPWDGKPWEVTDPVSDVLDVVGYNYQWKQYVPDHERRPKRMIVGTESTAGEAFETWNLVMENPHVLGDFVWTSLDYLGESGIGRVHYQKENPPFCGAFPWHQANCGDIDLCGFKRPQSWYRDILWNNSKGPFIFVHSPVEECKTPIITYWGWPEVWPSWTWPGSEGKNFKIDVYSGYDEIELFLNGRSLGVKPSGSKERHIASFEAPFEPGILKAVARQDGSSHAEAVLTTSARPESLRLGPDRKVFQAGGGGLCYVAVEILDETGMIHPGADRPVYFTVQGEAVIQAVGNADPVSTEEYTGNRRSTFKGRCLCVLRSTSRSGPVVLRAQADGLLPSEIRLETR